MSQRLSCWKCNQGISPGQSFLNALGHTWHDTCFSCRNCNTRLGTGEFYTLNNEPYCPQCHVTQDVPNCAKCNQPVRRGVDFLKYEGQSYHAHCFTCESCNRELSTSDFFKHNGKRYCAPCSDNMSRSNSYSGGYSSNSNSSPSYGSGNSSYGSNNSTSSYGNNSSPYASTSSSYGSSNPQSRSAGGASTYGGSSGGASTYGGSGASSYGGSGASTYGGSGGSTYGAQPVSTYGSSSNNSYGNPSDDHYSVAVEEDYNPNHDYTAEISIGVVPTHDTMSATHHASHHDASDANDANDLNALVAELESSGSDFNSKYGGGSTYNNNADDSDPLAAALRSLQDFEGA